MPFIKLRTNRVSYEFNITQKYNLLVGDSGTGKTTLYSLVDEMNSNHNSVDCAGYSKVITDHQVINKSLSDFSNYVIILDETSPLLHEPNSPTILEQSNNYFLIICRDVTLGYKSISLDCIFKLRTTGKFHYFERMYSIPEEMFDVSTVMCEDSNSGFQFLENIFSEMYHVAFAKASKNDKTGGKAKIATCLYDYTGEKVCIVFDKCAIGYQFSGILESIIRNKITACFIDWDSFEAYILSSKIFDTKVPEPECNYESKEVLATEVLAKIIPYNKPTLSKCLIEGKCYTCKDAYTCLYKHYSSNDLIYWKVKKLLDVHNASSKDELEVK